MKAIIVLALLLLVSQAAPSVTVSLDHGWYSAGESLTIHIKATGDASDILYLWMYIEGPDGRTLHYTPLPFRSQTFVWMIPGDAVDGPYKVRVTWGHRYTETGFIVQSQPIPEFPFMPAVVFVFALAAATLAMARRKASART